MPLVAASNSYFVITPDFLSPHPLWLNHRVAVPAGDCHDADRSSRNDGVVRARGSKSWLSLFSHL
jgi:hypothetical protein